jgi:rhodanese-related sulfurtransferase
MEFGFTNVTTIRGGFAAWQEAGYATESGS